MQVWEMLGHHKWHSKLLSAFIVYQSEVLASLGAGSEKGARRARLRSCLAGKPTCTFLSCEHMKNTDTHVLH